MDKSSMDSNEISIWKPDRAQLDPQPHWRLEAAITGTRGNAPLPRGGRHLCRPVSVASSRVILSLGGVKVRLANTAASVFCLSVFDAVCLFCENTAFFVAP
jgi:hypothetical protein